MEKGKFRLENGFWELGIKNEVVWGGMSSMCKERVKDRGLEKKCMLGRKKMFGLGVVWWLLDGDVKVGEKMVGEKFGKKGEIGEGNVKVV